MVLQQSQKHLTPLGVELTFQLGVVQVGGRFTVEPAHDVLEALRAAAKPSGPAAASGLLTGPGGRATRRYPRRPPSPALRWRPGSGPTQQPLQPLQRQ